MKKYHKILLVLSCATILVTAGIIISLNVIDRNRTKAMISVIYEYCDSINAKDFDRYANVYTKEYAEEILECVQKGPERATFHNSEMSIKQITEIDIETAQAVCAYNLDGIRNNCRISGVFYVQIHEKYDGRDMVENRAFIIVEDAGEYKIKDLPYVEVNVLSQFIRVENLEYVNEIISNNRIILQKQYSSNEYLDSTRYTQGQMVKIITCSEY